MRIDSSEWQATATIDFITIEFPKSKLKTLRAVTALSWSGRGTVECAKRFGLWHGHGCDWLTVHDPDRQALQFLIDHFPRTQILGLEISVDLRPKDTSNVLRKLTMAHDWLTHSLFPQKHKLMEGVTTRKQFDAATKTIAPKGLKLRSSRTTVYWQNRTGFEQVRLYVKRADKHIATVNPSTRLEATLNRGGCQMAGLPRLESLPEFATHSRRYLSPFFEVACGIRPKIKRIRSKNPIKMTAAADQERREIARVKRHWDKYGASWAAKHGYQVIPDKSANRLIGGALNELRRDLMKLKLP